MRTRSLVFVTVLVAFVIVMAALMQTRGPHGSVIYADLAKASGLREGATVSFRGIDVGRVSHIAFLPNGLRVTITLSRPDVPLRTGDGARARLNGLFGDVALELVPVSGTGGPLPEGGILSEVPPDADMLRLQLASEELSRSLARVLNPDSARDSLRKAPRKP
jgi:ABC-type transporter Mla subunit MlaD